MIDVHVHVEFPVYCEELWNLNMIHRKIKYTGKFAVFKLSYAKGVTLLHLHMFCNISDKMIWYLLWIQV